MTLEAALETVPLTEDDPVDEATEILLAAGEVVAVLAGGVVVVLAGGARAGVATGLTGVRVVVVARAAVVDGVVGVRRAVAVDEAVDEAVDVVGVFLTVVGVVATGFLTVEGDAVVGRVVEGVVLVAVDARTGVGEGLLVEVGLALLAARAAARAARRSATKLAADGVAVGDFLTVPPGLAGALLETEAFFAEEGLAGSEVGSGTEVGWSVGVPGAVWGALWMSASSTMALGLSGSSTTLSREGVPGATSSTSMSDIYMFSVFFGSVARCVLGDGRDQARGGWMDEGEMEGREGRKGREGRGCFDSNWMRWEEKKRGEMGDGMWRREK